MPKKRDQSYAHDHPQFVERLKECVETEGSIRAFSIKAGILPSTFGGYLRTRTEPPRDVLIKIAKAANVSVGWLVDGSVETGPSNPSPGDLAAPPRNLQNFRKNLNYMILKGKSSGTSLSETTGLNAERLQELTRGGSPSFDEILALSAVTNMDTLFKGHEEYSDFTVHAMVQAHEAELSGGEPAEGIVGLPIRGLSSTHRLSIALMDMLGSEDLEWAIQSDESMAPTLEQGDVAIALRRSELTGSGLYLFRREKKLFVARATVTPDERVLLNYDNPEHRKIGTIQYSAKKYVCVGPVLLKVIRLRKPGISATN